MATGTTGTGQGAMGGKTLYRSLHATKATKQDEHFATNLNKLALKIITTSYHGSPTAGQGTLFPEYNAPGNGNGKRQKPKALGVIVDRVQD